MHEFEIGGTLFAIRPLKLKQALKAEALLIEVFLPAFGAMTQPTNIDPLALAGLERIDELVDIFASACRFDRAGTGSAEKGVELRSFLDEGGPFEHQNAKVLAWLAACVEWQFADFFDGSGLPLLQAAASRFESLMKSIGGSGESSPTGESPTG